MRDEANDPDEALWIKVAADLREEFEHYLAKLKRGLFDSQSPKATTRKKKTPPIVHVRAMFVDVDTMMPLAIFDYDSLGTPEEIARLLQSKMEAMIDSFAYRRGQQLAFNHLKDNFKIKDRTILDMLIPAADSEERERVYGRLTQSRRRLKVAKRTTKSPVCSLDKPPK